MTPRLETPSPEVSKRRGGLDRVRQMLLRPSGSGLVQLVRYALVGGLALMVDFGVLFALTHFAGVHYLVSAMAAFLAGLAVNYVLSLIWVFPESRLRNRVAEFGIFALVGVVGLGLNEAGMWLLAGRLGVHYMLAKGATASVVFFWNFGARKAILFQNTRGQTGSRAVNWTKIAIAVAACYYVAAGAALIYTRVPFVDEGNFAGSALNLLRTGHSGVESVPPWGLGIPLPASQTFNFWVMPGFIYLLSAWYAVFPQTLFSARLLSFAIGGLAIFLYFFVVRKLSGSARFAAFCTLLCSTDFNTLTRMAVGRMDSLCLALNLGAWWAFLTLRERSLGLALAAGAAFGSLSLMVHPNGIFAFSGLLVLLVLFDVRRVKLRDIVLCGMGAALPLLLMIPVVMQNPTIWAVQMANHSRGRFSAVLNPIAAIKQEFEARYYRSFGGTIPLSWSPRSFLLLALVLYTAALVYMLLRFRELSLVERFSLWMFAIPAVYFTFFDAGHFGPYGLNLLPWLCALSASAVVRLIGSGRRRIAIAATAAALLINAGAAGAYALTDRYHRNFLAVVERVRAEMSPDDLLLSYSFFGLPLGFRRVVEDYTLVSVLKRHPKFVTLNESHFHLAGDVKTWVNGQDPVEAGMITAAEKEQARRYFQTHYQLVLSNYDFQLYRHN